MRMAQRECLELSGGSLRIQNSRRILAVVWVWCIFGWICETDLQMEMRYDGMRYQWNEIP